MIAGACGLMETVVEVMKTHINNEKICVSGCGMFWTIATECKQLFNTVYSFLYFIHRYQPDQNRRN